MDHQNTAPLGAPEQQLHLRPVQWRPHGLAHKQPHRLGVVVLIQREAVVDAWQESGIPLQVIRS
jgi:hypothetical protein